MEEKIDSLKNGATSNLLRYRDRLDKAGSINDIDAIETQSKNSISHHYDRLEKIKEDIANNVSYAETQNLIVTRI